MCIKSDCLLAEARVYIVTCTNAFLENKKSSHSCAEKLVYDENYVSSTSTKDKSKRKFVIVSPNRGRHCSSLVDFIIKISSFLSLSHSPPSLNIS